MATNLMFASIAATSLGLLYFTIKRDEIIPSEEKLSKIHAPLFSDLTMSNPGTFNDKIIEKHKKVVNEIHKRATK